MTISETPIAALSKWGEWYRRNYPRSPLTDEQVRCLDVFQGTATGLYNVYRSGERRLDGGFRPCGNGIEVHLRGSYSTFDGSELTALVVNAHKSRVRVDLSAKGNMLIAYLHPRHEDGGLLNHRHPGVDRLAHMIADTGTSGYREGDAL